METEQENYQPGACNIGPHEVEVRKKFFRFFLPFTILLTGAAIWFSCSLLIWFLLLFTSFSAIVLYFEIKYRFCILFGFFGLHNFEKLGSLHDIKNKTFILKDRKRVLEIVIQSLALSLAFATAVHFMAGFVHPL